MPSGMYIAGDYMATSSFNGALESGVNDGLEMLSTELESKIVEMRWVGENELTLHLHKCCKGTW